MTALLAPTATKIPDDAKDRVVVCGSHGGAYAGYLIIQHQVLGFVLNDAGVGLDDAGIGSLALAEQIGMAAATTSADSAMIGEPDDMLATGVISHVNGPAAAAGCEPGMACSDAVACLEAAAKPTGVPEAWSEARHVEGSNPHGLQIVCIDSVSLVDREADIGQIVVSGSHGGVVGGRPDLALQVDARAGFYNDAGVGKNLAGITRLPALDERGIIAGTVSAASARIGDGRSTLYDGVLSYVNQQAVDCGISPGMRLEDAVKVISHAA